jgi:hypothetical protein
VVHALRGWPTPFGIVINPNAVDGQDEARAAVLAGQVIAFARMSIATEG